MSSLPLVAKQPSTTMTSTYGSADNVANSDVGKSLLTGREDSMRRSNDNLSAAANEDAMGGAAAGGSIAAGIQDESVIERLAFVAALKKNRDRVRHCRTVPFSVLTYALYITALLVHVSIGLSYDFEMMLLQSVPLPVVPADFLPFLRDTLLDALLPNSPDTDPSQWRRINGNVLVVGGVRILTQRRAVAACPLPTGPLLDLYGPNCGSPTGFSLDPFGNTTAADAFGVASAFEATTVSNDPTGARFQLVLDPTAPSEDLKSSIDGLIAGHWIDNLTASADVQFATLNGEAGLFGRASLHVAFSLGSLDTSAVASTSVPVDFYFGANLALVIIDIVLLLYWLYLVAGTVRRVKEALFPRNAATPWSVRLWRLGTSYWRLLDLATTLSMLVTFVMWWVLLGKLAAVRDHFSSVDSVIPSVEQDIFNAATWFGYFKVAAVVTLAALTLRLFKYFAYQPRLAVISESISRGCGDALHFMLLLAVLVVFFVIWGYFMFGTQSNYWNTPESAIMSCAKFFMYDYDFDGMRAAFPFMADLYYILFMFIMANLMLWLFLAIFFDTYTEVRSESHRGPSAWSELGSVLSSANDWAPRFLPSCTRSRGSGSNIARKLVPRDDVTMAEVLHEATKGSLRLDTTITALSLVHALGLKEAAAQRLISDAYLAGKTYTPYRSEEADN